jgi:hypothetical protein
MKPATALVLGLWLPIMLVLGSAIGARAQVSAAASAPPSSYATPYAAELNGAVIGGLAGAYIAAWPVFIQGAGAGSSSALPWMAAGVAVGALAGAGAGYLIERQWPAFLTTPTLEPLAPGYSALSPRRGQFDVQVENLSGFTGPGSLVRVREFSLQGTGLQFGDLGLDTQQIPSLDLRYWITARTAVHFRFRYFAISGSHFLNHPVLFNGARIAPGQTLDTSPDWYSGGLYLEHSLRSWYAPYEAGLPAWLRRWDLRLRVGIEFTYVNFVINGGHAQVTPSSHGSETKEDFYHQEMVLPTLGLEAYRPLGDHFWLAGEVEGNWINRWNSLRNEGGTVWASQSGVEAHLRLVYFNFAGLGSLQPMVGFFYYYYRQFETSSEDGNFLRWSTLGPEVGIDYSF